VLVYFNSDLFPSARDVPESLTNIFGIDGDFWINGRPVNQSVSPSLSGASSFQP